MPLNIIRTCSIKTLSIKGLFVTLSIMTFSINDTLHNSTLSVIMLNVAFYLLLCWVSLCWMSLCWVSWRLNEGLVARFLWLGNCDIYAVEIFLFMNEKKRYEIWPRPNGCVQKFIQALPQIVIWPFWEAVETVDKMAKWPFDKMS
jgi:hypothetical protein